MGGVGRVEVVRFPARDLGITDRDFVSVGFV